MPAGVTWGVYLRFVTASMLTMFAGAQCVHLVYRPMDDLPHYVELERQRRTAAQGGGTVGAEREVGTGGAGTEEGQQR